MKHKNYFLFFENIGLRGKLILALFLGIVMISIFFGWVRIKTEQDHLQQSINIAGAGRAKALAAGAANLVAGYDYGNLEGLAKNLLNQPDVLAVTIRNINGRAMADFSKTTPEKGLRFDSPIQLNNREIGQASLTVSTKSLEQASAAAALRITIEQILGGLLLSFIIYLLVSRAVVAPVQRLTRAMESAETDNGNLGEALPFEFNDEIGKMVQVYNRLTVTLSDYHDKLHQKIDLADQALVEKNKELEKALALVERMATTDSLTELPNRRYYDEMIAVNVAQNERYGEPLSLVLFDLDKFKDINDTLGHPAGDAVLKHMAAILRDHARKADIPARLGGDEFAIILSHADEALAEIFVKNLRAALAAHPFIYEDKPIPCTISIGIAQFDPSMLSPEGLYFAADKACYASKRDGRNRYTLYSQLINSESRGLHDS